MVSDHTATSLQHYCLSVIWYGLCRQGKIDDTVELLTTSAPSMPDYIRTAVIDLVKSQPEFYPMPSWTHLSQLHGPKVGADWDCYACTKNQTPLGHVSPDQFAHPLAHSVPGSHSPTCSSPTRPLTYPLTYPSTHPQAHNCALASC